jgi:hypothetical protein
MDDSVILEEVRRYSGDRKKQRVCCDRILAQAKPIARKALWAYSHYLLRTGQDAHVEPTFIEGYLHAWRDSILYLANGADHLKFDVVGDLSHTVIAGWHFPEHTALISKVAEANALVLVAEEQAWMRPLRERNCLYCFREGFSLALPRALSAGRPVFAMFDFCYPETRHIITDFLSYPTRMPAGLLQLARRYNYALRLASIRGRKIQFVANISSQDRDETQIAAELNRKLEREILRRPERWLMWPSVDQRWIGVDYGDDA